MGGGGGGGGVGWGGVGWGGMITFMFLCTHRHSNLIIFLPVEQRQAQLCHDQLPLGGWVGGWGGGGGVGWGGVGWDDNVHVPMHTQAHQPHHLSPRRAEMSCVTSDMRGVVTVVR